MASGAANVGAKFSTVPFLPRPSAFTRGRSGFYRWASALACATFLVACNGNGSLFGGGGSGGGTAPTISTQPRSQTVNAGATATFSVVAAGSGTLAYQW